MEATIKLFRALPIERRVSKSVTKRLKAQHADVMEKTIKRGFVFTDDILTNYTNYDELIALVEKTVGLTAKQMNSSFHKSWKKVKDASIEQLVIEQIMHYFTTYGFEALGIDSDFVYIPDEALSIPKVKLDKIKLTVIKGYTKDELKEKLLSLLETGIALAEDTIQAVVEVAMYVGLSDFDRVRNKEVKAALYDYSGLIPENPTEFLRYMIFKATSTTLLIKSPSLIASIKDSNNLNVTKLFEDYEKKYGLARLAEIFYRFKPLFLAFRTNARIKVLVNKIRRLAVKNHKPMPEDFLNTVTARIKHGEELAEEETTGRDELELQLSRVNTFRKIRLAYALKFRTKDAESILYRIRNGKGYATAFSFDKQAEAEMVLGIVLDSIAKDVSKNVKGKKIYIPDTINYSLPATEKQFTGNLPSGSYVVLPNDMIAGVHWNNVNHHRIDLDLSLISLETGKVGWDSWYRTEARDVMFSGDVTDARNGASELFFVAKQKKKAFIMNINYFNFDKELPVPFKILVAKGKTSSFKKNYTVNPNDVVVTTNSVIDEKQKVLGLLVTSKTENRFYFAEINVGKSITSRETDYTKHSRQFLLDYYDNTIGLRDVLVKAGAEIVSEKADADIDLSLETLEKDSILGLLK